MQRTQEALRALVDAAADGPAASANLAEVRAELERLAEHVKTETERLQKELEAYRDVTVMQALHRDGRARDAQAEIMALLPADLRSAVDGAAYEARRSRRIANGLRSDADRHAHKVGQHVSAPAKARALPGREKLAAALAKDKENGQLLQWAREIEALDMNAEKAEAEADAAEAECARLLKEQGKAVELLVRAAKAAPAEAGA